MNMITISVAALMILALAMYFLFGDVLRQSGRTRSRLQTERGNEYDRFGNDERDYNNPYIPDFIEKNPGRALIYIFVSLLLLNTALDCIHSVPPGHRGVLITMGKVTERDFGEGLQFKLPYIQKFVDMKVMLEKEMVEDEDAASSDLQEIKTTLTVHFNVVPGMAWDVYKNMRKDYHNLLLRPVIQEDLKATTALFTAEELIKTRSQLVVRLNEKLRASLSDYSIYVQTVNFVNFQFSDTFTTAIEAKVTAEQAALEAQNYLEQVKYEAQQKIIQAEAQKNATIITAEAQARQVEIAANAEAYRVEVAAEAWAYKTITEANGTAEAIMLITDQMTPEYARYLHLMQWDGKYPSTMLGSLEDLGVIINTTP